LSPERIDYRRRNEWGERESSGGWRDRITSALPVSMSGLILLICIVAFILCNIFPQFAYYYLTLNPYFVMQRPWTLITSMFVHFRFDHLLLNMLFLFFFATNLERLVGERKFLAIYIVSGIVAGAAQMLVTGGFSYGASGALYGVLGCLAVIAPQTRILLFFVIPMGIRAAVLLFALIEFMSLGSMDGIGHMAHLAGILVGLAYGEVLTKRPKYYYDL